MTKLLLAALIILPRLALCQRPEPLPQLELRAELEADASRLRVAWTNRGTRPFLITVGSIIGWAGLIPNFRISISGPGLPTSKLNDTAQPGGIAGRAEPLVVCLASGAEYSLKFATDKLWLPGYKKTLSNVRNRRWTVIVAYTGVKAFHDTPDGRRIPYDITREYPAEFPFWTGDIKAEVVNAPQR